MSVKFQAKNQKLWKIFKKMLKTLLLATILVHHVVVWINTAAFLVLPFTQSPFVACPIMSFVLLVSFSKQPCPLTQLENHLRSKLGMKRIGGFIGHYYLRPLKTHLKGHRNDLNEKDE